MKFKSLFRLFPRRLAAIARVSNIHPAPYDLVPQPKGRAVGIVANANLALISNCEKRLAKHNSLLKIPANADLIDLSRTACGFNRSSIQLQGGRNQTFEHALDEHI